MSRLRAIDRGGSDEATSLALTLPNLEDHTVYVSSTHQKVSVKEPRQRPSYTADSAAAGIDDALRILEGRWKMKILFHLFDKGTLRFSELERHVSGVSQKMLIQQLKELEKDGIIARTVYPVVPPKVDYRLTKIGQDLCPVLDAILEWAERRSGLRADPS